MNKRLLVTRIVLFVCVGSFALNPIPSAFAGSNKTVESFRGEKAVKHTLSEMKRGLQYAVKVKEVVNIVRFIEETIPKLSSENATLIQELKEVQVIGQKRLGELIKALDPKSEEFSDGLYVLIRTAEDTKTLEELDSLVMSLWRKGEFSGDYGLRLLALNPNSQKILPKLLSHLKPVEDSLKDFDQIRVNEAILEGIVQNPKILELFPDFKVYLRTAGTSSVRKAILIGVLKNPNAVTVLPEFKSEFDEFNPAGDMDSIYMRSILEVAADHLENGLVDSEWVIKNVARLTEVWAQDLILSRLIARSQDPALHRRILNSFGDHFAEKASFAALETVASSTKDSQLLKEIYERWKDHPAAFEILAAVASNEKSFSFSFDRGTAEQKHLVFLGKISNPKSKLFQNEIKEALDSFSDSDNKLAIYLGIASHSQAKEFFDSEEFFSGLMRITDGENILATYGESSDGRVEILHALLMNLRKQGKEKSHLAKKVRKIARSLPDSLDRLRVLLPYNE